MSKSVNAKQGIKLPWVKEFGESTTFREPNYVKLGKKCTILMLFLTQNVGSFDCSFVYALRLNNKF